MRTSRMCTQPRESAEPLHPTIRRTRPGSLSTSPSSASHPGQAPGTWRCHVLPFPDMSSPTPASEPDHRSGLQSEPDHRSRLQTEGRTVAVPIAAPQPCAPSLSPLCAWGARPKRRPCSRILTGDRPTISCGQSGVVRASRESCPRRASCDGTHGRQPAESRQKSVASRGSSTVCTHGVTIRILHV